MRIELILCHLLIEEKDFSKDITIYCVSTSGQYEFFIRLRDWNFSVVDSIFACVARRKIERKNKGKCIEIR